MHTTLYNDRLNDHYKNPRCHGTVENADFSLAGVTSTCGDTLEFSGRIRNTILVDVKQHGAGCLISQATASILAEYVTGKSITDILALEKNDITNLIGIALGPQRIQCALLALELLQKGIRAHARSQQNH